MRYINTLKEGDVVRSIYLCKNKRICERYYRSNLENAPSKMLRKIKKDIARLLDHKENGR